MRARVDLPLPLPPSMTVMSPGGASTSTPFSTLRLPNDFHTPANDATSEGAAAVRTAAEAFTAEEPNELRENRASFLRGHARHAAADAHEQLVGERAGRLGLLLDRQAVPLGSRALAEDHDGIA